MSLPSDFPRVGNITMGVVMGRGGQTDKYQDSTKAGNMQCFLVGKYNPGAITEDHLGLSTRSLPPTGSAQCTFPGVPDYGTMVFGYHQTGRNDIIACFIPNEVNKSAESGSPGNNNLLGALLQLFTKLDGRRGPPDYYETTRNGAKVRKIRNKFEWSHDKTKGLPTHVAMPTIAGIRIPQLSNIPTAIQKDMQLLSDSNLANLPGTIMSVGHVFALLAANADKVTKNMSNDTKQALSSLAVLAQNGEHLATGGATCGTRVDLSTFTNNAIQIVADAQNIDDILLRVEELLSNTAYHGTETFGTLSYTVETPFGNVSVALDHTGNANVAMSNTVSQAQTDFVNSMSSESSFPSSFIGQNLFGDSANTMFDMFQRAFTGNDRIRLSKELNTSDTAKKVWDGIKHVIKDGGSTFWTK